MYSKTPEYIAEHEKWLVLKNCWRSMHQRCHNPNNKAYKDYGGRGIKVCKRWTGPDGFANFQKDMGPKPTPKHSIDRIDNDGDYEPNNCRWATRHQQVHNQRGKEGRKITKDFGVNYDYAKGKWRARLHVNYTIVFNEWFDTHEEAKQARKAAEIKYLGAIVEL